MIFLKIGCFIVATLSIKSHRLRHQGRSSQNDEYKSQPSPHGVTGLQTGQLLPRFLTPDTPPPPEHRRARELSGVQRGPTPRLQRATSLTNVSHRLPPLTPQDSATKEAGFCSISSASLSF